MRKYKAKECRCWQSYPNKNYKYFNIWKCVDCYELVQDRKGNRKTKCKLKVVQNGN